MNERNLVYKIVCETEKRFGCICFSYKDGNASKTHVWWNICIDNYELYYSQEYREWIKDWHSKSGFVKLLFCYCNPLEEKLAKLAEEDNLILNV